VFHLQNTYGGLFSRVDIGDKGTNLLMFWGAPLAQENDVERALNFFLELRKESSVPILAGITYRLAYAGYMGGSLQEEYTCYGWGVSLAARLMMAAGPGEIWADEEIARRAGRRFSFQPVGEHKFKGFSQEQNVFKLLERKQDDRAVFSGEFIGREAELETLGRFIAPVWSGGFAGMLTVVGEPGIGKSRLIDAFRASSIFIENESYWAVCQADEIVRQSLNPFRYWLKRYFRITESKQDAESKQAFDDKLDELIESIPDETLSHSLYRTRSFLGELVDLRWPDSLYEKMDAQGRFDNTFIALSSLLRGESLRQPLVIVFEDAHLLDSDTKSFLLYLERVLNADAYKSYPIAILTTSRGDDPGVKFEIAPNEKIALSELTADVLAQLTENLLVGKVTPALLEILRQRVEGNPFFLEQILRYLQEEGRLEHGPTGWGIAGDQALESLPTDISAILVSRLDRLNREVKEVVQTASVLGREFELRLLSQMLHDDKTLPEKIHVAVEADVLSLLTEIRYIFRHALFRDAAYNMQLRTRQQELHQIAVDAFEVLYQDQLAPHYSEIAYHADRAGLRDKAKKFYILAGAEAARAYKNNLAIESYTRALFLSSMENIQERIDLLLARVALYRIIANRAGQEQDLATLELLAEKQKNKRNQAIVASRQAGFAFDLGDFHEAQQHAETAIGMAKSAQAPEVTTQVYSTLPLTLSRQGQFKQAIEAAQAGIELTQQIGDRPGEGQLYNELGLIYLEQRKHARAREYFEKSLSIAQETGNRRIEAQVLNNLGNISGMFDNDYINARRFFEQALEIVREIGNRTGEGFALGNIGWVASIAGDFDLARSCLMGRLTIARESGNLYLETFAMINLGAMMVTQENYSDALDFLEQSLELASKLKDRSIEAWAWTFLGFAHLGLGNLHDARGRFQAAYDIRHSLGETALAMEPLAGLAQVELDNSDSAGALGYVQIILSHLEGGGSLEGTEEPLRIYLTIYLTLVANRDHRAELVLENAYSVLQKHVSSIQGQANQEMFVQNVPWRRQINTLWMQKQAKG
jgi:predicted ATPase